MFDPRHVSPFLNDVPHFYTTTSFSPPPRLEPPTRPGDWVSFNALESTGSDGFEAFRASPDFALAQQQFLERIEQCEQFAKQHFTPEEAQSMGEGFSAFRRNLLDNNGAFFGDALKLLYGSGKRNFDNFCLRLGQDIDLHQRKTALRELAGQLHNCRSSGSAFHDAALSLDRAPGGLHGEFHDLLMQRIDALLQEVVNRPLLGVAQTRQHLSERQDRLRDMEVHMVNRLKMELDLPNPGALDWFVGGTDLIEPYQIGLARNLLKAQLRPVLLARELAERYMEQFRSKLPPEALAPDADLNSHMKSINDAHRAVSATYGPVSLHHLLMCDEETDAWRLQPDLSVLTHDLLEHLAAQNLIVPARTSSIWQEGSKDGIWDLMQVDWRLFLVEAREPPQAPPAKKPVQMHHAMAFLNQMRMAPPAALVSAVLSDTPGVQRQVPMSWLNDEANLTSFCRAQGDRNFQTWIERNENLAEASLSVLLPTLATLGMSRSFAAVLDQAPWPAAEVVRRAGGADMLLRALTASSDPVRRRWMAQCESALPALSTAEVKALVELPAEPLRRALVSATGATINGFVDLIEAAHTKCAFPEEKLEDLLCLDLESMMARGNAEALTVFFNRLAALQRRNVLPGESLVDLLGGEDGQGCSAALEHGQADVVDAFDEFVVRLFKQNVLGYNHVARLLGLPKRNHDSGSAKAIRNGHAAAFSQHLAHLQKAFQLHVFLREEISDQLACRDAANRPGLMVMLQSGRHPCLPAWRQAVAAAAKGGFLREPEVMRLLAPRSEDGAPWILSLLENPAGAHYGSDWLEQAHKLQAAGALGEHALVALLDGYPRHPQDWDSSLLLDAMQPDRFPNTVKQLINLFGFAYKRHAFAPRDLAQLLIPIQDLDSNRNAQAILRIAGLGRHVEAMLEGLRDLGQANHLSGSPQLMLLHAIARFRLARLSGPTQAGISSLLQSLLATAVATSEPPRVHAEFWGELLLNAKLPQDGPAPDPADQRSEVIGLLSLVDQAVTRAEHLGMIGATEMAKYLRDIHGLESADRTQKTPPPVAPKPKVPPERLMRGAANQPPASAQSPLPH